ncbi:MAG: ABC transporter ATP-binding protein [Clostridiales bacterium]|jgi:oligopeptide transport system ATP-binding protein|nr:ABC transporter ATP-binding protein [Eubacteriales bacterium]MDH7566129.1 ABC transporter ATP-binding protein [Clostridiales bacterium]
MGKLLEIKNLRTAFKTYAGEVCAVNGISFCVSHGEAVGIVGESGSGKSVTMLSVMKLLADNGRMVDGDILFDGVRLNDYDDRAMQNIRGKSIGMIFQDPMTSLNPVFTVGNQMVEAILKHNRIPRQQAWQKAVDMLKLVGIPNAEGRMKQYPHEFSGGMRQRVMIAMALSCEPKLLIADEPTTALDVTIQAQIIELMKELKNKINMAIILITHDLGVVADICERVIVMYGGIIVEQGKLDEIFYQPLHPYTVGLLNSIPRLNLGKNRLEPIEGQPPDMIHAPQGCPFVARCPRAMKICDMAKPEYVEPSEGHGAACWLLLKGHRGEM